MVEDTSADLNLQTIIGDVNMLTKTSHTLLQPVTQAHTGADMADDSP